LLVWYLIAVTHKLVTVCEKLTGRGIGECGKELQDNEEVSPNESEPGSASLHYIAVVNLPKVVKPNPGGWEETSSCTSRAARGDRGGRAPKGYQRNLGDSSCMRGKSDKPIVVKRRSDGDGISSLFHPPGGAKGLYHKRVFVEKEGEPIG
jgi:hypothetical protein